MPDIERIERFVVASDFMKAQKALDSNAEGFLEMEKKVSSLVAEATSYKKQIDKKKIEKLSAKFSGEFDNSHSELK